MSVHKCVLVCVWMDVDIVVGLQLFLVEEIFAKFFVGGKQLLGWAFGDKKGVHSQ